MKMIGAQVRRVVPGGFSHRAKMRVRCGWYEHANEIKEAAEAALLRRWRSKLIR